jgi:membrane-bound lytic murein transglycosylase B
VKQHQRALLLSSLLLVACAHAPPALNTPPPKPPAVNGYLARDDVQQFIARVIEQDHLERSFVDHAIAGAHPRQPILDAIAKPAEAKPWFQYEPLFVSETRISAGVSFWDQQQATLAKAEAEYNVPAEILVAIVGVESYFGRQHGGYPVIDALVNLSFDYPSRAAFFQGELEQFLIMCQEQSLDPLAVMGSYAGAMGAPQFMPDSYRQYAVDFDGDGKRDIWNDWADIIGSVANYFHAHGWIANGLVVLPAALKPADAAQPAPLQPTTVGALRQAGVVISAGVDDGEEAVLIVLDQADGKSYWVGLHNFRVITQYNRSPLYAMAVIELGHAIAERRAAATHASP